ncbi:MAG: helix-turn-helix transcriptional regulator [Gordonia sp. (in: high G+C Gram-positive bacteria)]|uniref:helix-turn-helix transcriptional regulator n=1 Tax=Gordonia sp. (in: high G+C Gram-positive bacteria) TaxID=84139 RepID=UPI0039E65F1B
MVRVPLTPEQIAAGRRLGSFVRQARAGRDLESVAAAAGISPETLRKIEAGRISTPSFGTVVAICAALELPVADVAEVWTAQSGESIAM